MFEPKLLSQDWNVIIKSTTDRSISWFDFFFFLNFMVGGIYETYYIIGFCIMSNVLYHFYHCQCPGKVGNRQSKSFEKVPHQVSEGSGNGTIAFIVRRNAQLEHAYQLGDSHCVKSVRIRRFSGPYLVRMWGNAYQKNSEYGDFLHNVKL